MHKTKLLKKRAADLQAEPGHVQLGLGGTPWFANIITFRPGALGGGQRCPEASQQVRVPTKVE